MTDERRNFQRLRLAKPILSVMNGHNALILDIGITGALVEHYGDAQPGQRFQLIFRWKGSDVEFVAEVARTMIVRAPGGDGKSTVSHTGVHFVEAVGDSRDRLQDLMATFVGRVLVAQKANAAGDTAGTTILQELGGARRMRNRGYVTYLLKGDRWLRVSVSSPKQPPGEGFTVAAHEDEEEVEVLCKTYEHSDAEGRRLIRLVAELSAMSSEH